MNKHKVISIFMFILSLILAFIRIPIFPYAPFLTIDLSILPMLILAKKSNLKIIIILLILKSLILTYLQGANFISLIGNLSDLVFGAILICLYHLFKKNTFKSLFTITLITTVFMLLLNAFIIFPIYHEILKINLSNLLLWIAIIPYNIIKSSILLILNRIVINRKLI